MISDGVIGTTELADDAITPVKLDETGSYIVAGLTANGNTVINERLDVNKQGEAFRLRTGGASTQNYISIGRTAEDARITMSGGTNNAIQSSAAGDLVIGANNNLLMGRIGSPYINLNSTGVVINELGGSDKDFRVESDNQGNMFWVDASSDKIAINTGTLKTTVNLQGGLMLGTGWSGVWNDANYYVKDNWLSNLVQNGYGGDINAGIDLGSASTQSGNYNNTHRWRIQTSGTYSTKLQFVAMQTGSSSYNPANVTEDVAMEITGGGNLYTYASAVFNEDGTDNDFRIESINNSTMFYVDASADSVGIGAVPSASYDLVVGGDTIIEDTQVGLTVNATDNGSGTPTSKLFVQNYPARGSKLALKDTSGREFGLKKDYAGGNTLTYAYLYGSNGSTEKRIAQIQEDGDIFFNPDAVGTQTWSVKSDNNSYALSVDTEYDNVLMGRSSAQSYNNTGSDMNVEATGSFSTSAVTKSGVGTTYVNSGWTIPNTRQVWLISLVGNNGTSNAHSTATYILNVAAYSKTLVQLGTASNHFGNGYLSAQLDSGSAASVNIQVRWNSLYAGGTSDVVVQGIRLI